MRSAGVRVESDFIFASCLSLSLSISRESRIPWEVRYHVKWRRFIHNFKTSLDPIQYLTQANSLFRIKEWQESSRHAPCS